MKLALAKNLAILDEQSFENENARDSLRQFIKSVEQELGDAGEDAPLDQGPFALQSADLQDAAPREGSLDASELQGLPGPKEGKAFATGASHLSHVQASENTAAGDASVQQPMQGSHIETGAGHS